MQLLNIFRNSAVIRGTDQSCTVFQYLLHIFHSARTCYAAAVASHSFDKVFRQAAGVQQHQRFLTVCGTAASYVGKRNGKVFLVQKRKDRFGYAAALCIALARAASVLLVGH